jgi:hypothetical protein
VNTNFNRSLLCKAFTVAVSCIPHSSALNLEGASVCCQWPQRGLTFSSFTLYDKWRAVGGVQRTLPRGHSSRIFTYRVVLPEVYVSSIVSFIPANVEHLLSLRSLPVIICMDDKCLYSTQVTKFGVTQKKDSFLKWLVRQPTYALTKIYSKASIKFLHVSAPGCHLQGDIRNKGA